MQNCDHSICPGWSILFLYAPAHKVCLLIKFMFELQSVTKIFAKGSEIHKLKSSLSPVIHVELQVQFI